MFGLLYLLNHWCMLGIKEIPANKTCTSVPQEWHKPRGDSIEPEPVMKCSFSKASLTRMASENYIQSLASFMMLKEET